MFLTLNHICHDIIKVETEELGEKSLRDPPITSLIGTPFGKQISVLMGWPRGDARIKRNL